MKDHIRQILINWAKCKDRVPENNSHTDPLYSVKRELLIHGDESLGDRTYQDWSKDVENRVEKRNDYIDSYLNPAECLTWTLEAAVLEHLSIDVSDIKKGHLTALKSVWHVIESLNIFSSEILLETLISKPIHIYQNTASIRYRVVTTKHLMRFITDARTWLKCAEKVMAA